MTIRSHIDLIEKSLNDADRLKRAEAMGFDTSKIWYHGTTAKTNFKKFRIGKDGIDELGKGIYFSGHDWAADAWARGSNGRLLKCFLKKGNYFDLSRLKLDSQGPGHTREKAYKELHPKHSEFMTKLYGENGAYDYESFKTLMKSRNLDASTLLFHLGYLGAYDHTSQIPDQIVVFDPVNIRCIDAKFDPTKADSPIIMA